VLLSATNWTPAPVALAILFNDLDDYKAVDDHGRCCPSPTEKIVAESVHIKDSNCVTAA